MDEKANIMDMLNMMEFEFLSYNKLILNSDKIQLRNIIMEIRNNIEIAQYELLKTAINKGYIIEEEATVDEINKIKNEIM